MTCHNTLCTKKMEMMAMPEPVIRNDGAFVLDRKVFHEKTTIQHFQLRNLITCANTRTVVHPFHNALHFLDVGTGTDARVLDDLPFAPTAIDTGFGYAAMAGPRGMALVQDLSSGWSTGVFSTGPGMNNSIVLSKHGENDIRVTVCNNNHTMSVYTLPGLERLTKIEMPSAINHTAVSRDGKQMLAVSDTGKVYVYWIAPEGEYKLKATYHVSREPCLSCAWHSDAEMFAVTSQDGSVGVYMTETGHRICKLGSSETRKTRRAARSVQFSQGTMDLMAYAEHVSQINIVDTRTFETRQIVRIAPEDVDLHITGLCFSPDNRSLFVGLENSLIELKLDTGARHRFGSGRINML